MKKKIWSLAALMLMAAPVMTSCSNDLDEVAPVEEAKSNVVTITIAPPAAEPETRVAMGGTKGLTITGWEEGDVVNLYKATEGTTDGPMSSPAKITGTGVAFICTEASTGTFSATLPDGENIGDYNLAIFGGTAEYIGDDHEGKILIKPTTWSSTDLKNVVMMGAIKDDEGKFTMKVINNVLKIENQSGADVTVAWYGYDSYSPVRANHYFKLACVLGPSEDETWKWYGNDITAYEEIPTWADVPNFTLVNNAVNYVNFPMVGDGFSGDKIGLYTSIATAVVQMKPLSGRFSPVWDSAYCGHLLDAGTYN